MRTCSINTKGEGCAVLNQVFEWISFPEFGTSCWLEYWEPLAGGILQGIIIPYQLTHVATENSENQWSLHWKLCLPAGCDQPRDGTKVSDWTATSDKIIKISRRPSPSLEQSVIEITGLILQESCWEKEVVQPGGHSSSLSAIHLGGWEDKFPRASHLTWDKLHTPVSPPGVPVPAEPHSPCLLHQSWTGGWRLETRLRCVDWLIKSTKLSI